MKTLFRWGVCLVLLLAAAQPLLAKEKNVVAVVPFAVNSAENIDYIRQGIADMLSSRISISDKIEVVSRDAVQKALQEKGKKALTLNDVYGLGGKFGADYVIWGSITKFGSILNIDGKLLDVAAKKQAVTFSGQCPTMDDVMPKINDFASKVEIQILGSTIQAAQAAAPAPPVPSSRQVIVSRKPATPQSTREAEIISGMRGGKRGTFTSSINPDFINAEQPLNRSTFWKSQQFSTLLRGMDIGDVNGDGMNETVMIDTNSIMIYQKTKKGGEFKLIQTIQGKSYDNYISVDVGDFNNNGIKEIIVSNDVSQVAQALIVEFRDGKFQTIASDLPWFLRVIDNGSGEPLLVGQRRGLDDPFDTQIYEIVYREGKYVEGRAMKIPKGLSVFGLTLSRMGASSTERIVSLNTEDYLCVFEQTTKPLSDLRIFGGSDEFIWKSEDVFGGSNTNIDPQREGSAAPTDDLNKVYFINLRILNYDTNKDGKQETIIVKNASASARLLERVKLFSSAEVYDLEWDGTGMVENWRTKKINGYVSDYQFKDIDNDGENEVVLSLVLSVGGSMRGRSVIVAYDLKGP